MHSRLRISANVSGERANYIGQISRSRRKIVRTRRSKVGNQPARFENRRTISSGNRDHRHRSRDRRRANDKVTEICRKVEKRVGEVRQRVRVHFGRKSRGRGCAGRLSSRRDGILSVQVNELDDKNRRRTPICFVRWR